MHQVATQSTTHQRHAFTVDVEDYFQVTAFERGIAREQWDSLESRVVRSTARLLELLERKQVTGTFFVLGWVAERFPQLVRDIAAGGHEVGSHSYWHRLVYDLTQDEFREDLRRSRDILEDILGEPVRMYRAPTFSITKASTWAWDILVEEGFRIDSSVFPVRHDRYGMPDAPSEIHRIDTKAGELIEYPMSTTTLARYKLPIGGGGYFRLYPYPLTRYWLARCRHQPFMFYIHPWELDPEQPRVQVGSRITQFRHRVNLHRTEAKLERLFDDFKFGPVSEIVSQELGDEAA